MVNIKSGKEIKLMEDVCRIVAKFYEQLEKEVKPGISTLELDSKAEKIMRGLGAVPAQIGYNPGIKGVPPYMHSTCISVNDEVIHGVPNKNKIIKEGDIVSVDTVALKNGFNGDAARTFIVGKTSKDAKRLVRTGSSGLTRNSMDTKTIYNTNRAVNDLTKDAKVFFNTPLSQNPIYAVKR